VKRFPEELTELFEPVRVLGEGAHGVVYLAVERTSQVARAVKVLRARHGTENAARFEQEARVLGALRHRNIARIFAWGRWYEGYWLAMEYLEGETLRGYLERHGPVTSGRRMLEIVTQAARALHFAHKQGVLHRDVKPDNLFLAGHEVKLLDFGLAKLRSEGDSSVRTRQGILLGTPAYMAPERCRGEDAVVATDVYALAMVTWEILVGEPPFRGAPVDVLRAQLDRDPPPLPPHVPRPIDEAIQRGLVKDLEGRTATPKEFVIELRRAAREVVQQRRRGETPKEVEAVADFQDEDLASRSGEADVPDQGEVLPELPPTVAASAEVARQAVAEVAAESEADGGADLSEAPTRSLRKRRGGLWQASRALSRRLVAPGLLAPRWRPWILGAAMLVAAGGGLLFLRGPGEPSPPPRLRSWVVGTHGVAFQWEVEGGGARHLQVLPAEDTAPRVHGPERRPGFVEFGGLAPDREYLVWAAAPGEEAIRLHRFRTEAEFRVEEVELVLESDGVLRADIRATPPWRGAFRGQEATPSEEGYEEVRSLRFPAYSGEHPVLMAAGPGAVLKPRPEFVPEFVRSIRRMLDRVDVHGVSRELVDVAGEAVIDSRAALPAEVVSKLSVSLGQVSGMDLILHLRHYLPGLVGDGSLRDDERLALARSVAPLALIDATLHSLGADEVLGATGALSAAAADVFQEFQVVNEYGRRSPPPAPYRSAWFPVDANNLHPRSMPRSQTAEYNQQIARLYGDKPSLEVLEKRITLDQVPQGGGEVGLVMRATHPETVVFLQINERAVVPVRWRVSHGAKRSSGFITAFMNKGSVAEQLAPLTTRRFRLPSGVLRSGPNIIRVSCDTARREPDAWLPTVHGVFLRGDE
jgi:serine/threonine protein kinase